MSDDDRTTVPAPPPSELPTAPENPKPEELDVGALVVQQLLRAEMPAIVAEAMAPAKESLQGTANDVLEAIQNIGEQIDWMVKAVRDMGEKVEAHDETLEEHGAQIQANTKNIHRILDHLNLPREEDAAAPTQ